MAYTDQGKVEGYLNRDLTDEEQSVFDLLVAGAEDFIDGYCGRTFEPGRPNAQTTTDNTVGDKSSNSFQRFDGSSPEIFFDAPLQTDTTLKKEDGSSAGVFAPYVGYEDIDTGTFTLIDPSEYVFYPLNSKKKTSLMRNIGVFPYGTNNIFVYGYFGDSVIAPSAIQLATTIICADIINLPDGLTQETIEGYARTFNNDWNPTVQKILDTYRRVMI